MIKVLFATVLLCWQASAMYAQSSPSSYLSMLDDIANGRIDSHLSNLTTNAARYALAFEFHDALYTRCSLRLSGTGLTGGQAALPMHREELLRLAITYQWREDLRALNPPSDLGPVEAAAIMAIMQIYSSLPIKLHRDAVQNELEVLLDQTLSYFGGCSDTRLLALATNLSRLALGYGIPSDQPTQMVDRIDTGEGILFCNYYDDPSSSSAVRQRYNKYNPGTFFAQYIFLVRGDILTRQGCPTTLDPDYPMEVAYRRPTFDMSANTGDTVEERIANFFINIYLPSYLESAGDWRPTAEELEEVRQYIIETESVPIPAGAARAEAVRQIQRYIERGEERFMDRTRPGWRNPDEPRRLCVIEGTMRSSPYYSDRVFPDVRDVPFLIRRYEVLRCDREIVEIRTQG